MIFLRKKPRTSVRRNGRKNRSAGNKTMHIDEMLLTELKSKDDLIIKLGDAIDAKINIGLVLIVFLATQTAFFLEKSLPGRSLQIIAAYCLGLAAVCALVGLWPRKFLLPYPESNISGRIKELAEHYAAYPNLEENVTREITKNDIEWTSARITGNQRKNMTKSQWLSFSFWLTAGALLLNIACVILLIHPS
jgi:hypothetical protein